MLFLPTPTDSPLPLPTLPNLPPPTGTPTQTPLPDVLPKFPLDGYVVLFTRDGDLYFQDGENTPVRLTGFEDKNAHSPHITLLSDDNQKVAIIRRYDSNVYSINTDGTQENIVISNDKMNAFGSGMKIGALRFVPHTHHLFFIAIQCETQDGSPCPTSAFLADADTGKIKKLVDLGLLFVNPYHDEYRHIKISPDGKMLAVGSSDGMDIFTMDGNLIRDNILPFTPSATSIVYPSLFWLPDSSGLIMALPNTIYHGIADGDLPAHTIWHYMIDNNTTFQIQIDPSPMLDTFQVSPDGNWIVYGGLPNDSSVYLGNLTDGHRQILGNAYQVYFSWGPDSKYFIATSAESVLGVIDTPILTPTCRFNQWVDANHFTCWSTGKIRITKIAPTAMKVYGLMLDEDVGNLVLIKPR
jgi:WD40 repeat protein